MKKKIMGIIIPLVISMVFGFVCAKLVYKVYDEEIENKLSSSKLYLIQNGEYLYILLVVLIFLATLVSFRKTLKDQSGQAMNMKGTLYFMLALITYSSFTIASGVGIYWITSNLFTIAQNLIVERKKVK